MESPSRFTSPDPPVRRHIKSWRRKWLRAHKKKGVDDDKPKQTAEMEARIGKDGCALIKKKTARIRKEKRLHKKGKA